MKFAKLSLAALAVVGFSSSAMALDMSSVTAKPYVNTKIYYETVDDSLRGNPAAKADTKLFNQKDSSGDAVVQAGVTGNFNSCWGYGLEYTVADTLGLENSVVSGTRVGAGHNTATAALPNNGNGKTATDTRDWMSQAYVTFKGCGTPLKNTTFKIGRQYLDTPLAFTETWNAAPNSFDAIVAVNSDIQNVTLVGAVVTGGNGIHGSVANADTFTTYAQGAPVATGNAALDALNNAAAEGNGAHAIGILTNFGVPVNLWYYNVRNLATAMWADANANINGIKLGAQYGVIKPKEALNAYDDTKGGAIMLGGNIAGFDLSASYSKMNDDGLLPLANTATMYKNGNVIDMNHAAGKKTKLYTAGIYTDGQSVAMPGSKAYKIKASTATPIGKLTAQYVKVKNDETAGSALGFLDKNTNQKELDLILGTKVLGIDTKLIYIQRKFDDAAASDDSKHVRVILSKKF